MRHVRTLAAIVVGALVVTGCAGKGSSASSPTAAALVDIGAGLQGVDGLHATVYGTGLIHATAMAFDSHGRLWVATADYSDAGQDALYVIPQPGAPPVAVMTGLHTPLGLLWIDDTVYVASKERVDAYAGFDGTAFASQHNVVTLPAGVGEVNGLALDPDGRIQLGISAPCDHCTPASELSGAVVSFLPDGTDLQVDASGIRAPIGLAYFPDTSTLFVTMNQRDDLGDADTGRLVVDRAARPGMGISRLLRPKQRVVRRQAGARGRARRARCGERRGHRHGRARHQYRHGGTGGGMADGKGGAGRTGRRRLVDKRRRHDVPDRPEEPVRSRARSRPRPVCG